VHERNIRTAKAEVAETAPVVFKKSSRVAGGFMECIEEAPGELFRGGGRRGF
jgi:hypothetical protein